MLSQLAVFKDIIPGYRIRALTDKEKAEKVSQMVQRTRDWEQGLVSVYQNYLRMLEGEIKGTWYELRRYNVLTAHQPRVSCPKQRCSACAPCSWKLRISISGQT